MQTDQLLVMWDFETTGIPARYPGQIRPVQVGISVRTPDWREVAHFESFMRPDHWAKGYEYAEKVHGIRRSFLESSSAVPSLRDALTHTLLFLVGVGGRYEQGVQRPKLSHLAWNAKFDMEILRLWVEEGVGEGLNDALYPWNDVDFGGLIAPGGCVQTMYRDWTKTQPNVKTPRYGSLKDACAELGIDRDESQAHGALYDARLACSATKGLILRAS